VSTGPEVALRRARPEEAAALAGISTRAFHSDAAIGGPKTGGPPGYDSPEWQKEAMGWSEYYAVLVAGRLAGGAIVSPGGHGRYRLNRIFLDPEWHGQGIGRRLMALLWEAYPHARRWALDTPVWNRRTRRFYESLGFEDVGRQTPRRGPELVLYEWRAPGETERRG
jgi:GNAT superfamily N-acetyltransferase